MNTSNNIIQKFESFFNTYNAQSLNFIKHFIYIPLTFAGKLKSTFKHYAEDKRKDARFENEHL